MKRTVVVFLAVLVATAVGCQKKEEAAQTAAPQMAVQQAAPPAAAPQAGAAPAVAPQMPPFASPSGDPHAGLKMKEMAAGTGHKGKVLEINEAGSYTYLQVEEKGQKFWIAAMKTAVKKGDIVEFPDSPPVNNFQSKALNKTFDKLIFAEGVRVVQ